MKIHITDGPLKCKECGKQFTTSGRGTRQKWFSFFFFFLFSVLSGLFIHYNVYRH